MVQNKYFFFYRWKLFKVTVLYLQKFLLVAVSLIAVVSCDVKHLLEKDYLPPNGGNAILSQPLKPIAPPKPLLPALPLPAPLPIVEKGNTNSNNIFYQIYSIEECQCLILTFIRRLLATTRGSEIWTNCPIETSSFATSSSTKASCLASSSSSTTGYD